MRSLVFNFITIFIGYVDFAEGRCVFALTSRCNRLKCVLMANSIFIHHNISIFIKRLLIRRVKNWWWFRMCRGLQITNRSHENGIFTFHVERCGSVLIFVGILKLPISFYVYGFAVTHFLLGFFPVCPQIFTWFVLNFRAWTSTFLSLKRFQIFKQSYFVYIFLFYTISQ